MDESEENNEAKVVNRENEESFDEFDLIVMGKSRKGLTLKPLSDAHGRSSTPVLVDRFLQKHSIHGRPTSPANRDTKVLTPISSTNDAITTSFFSVAADGEVDLFEQSIDYKHMEDVNLFCDDSSDEDC